MTRYISALLFCFALLAPSQALATDYIFNCKNPWMQVVDVTVTANSITEARQLLRTDRVNYRDFDQCSFRRETPTIRRTQQDLIDTDDAPPTE